MPSKTSGGSAPDRRYDEQITRCGGENVVADKDVERAVKDGEQSEELSWRCGTAPSAPRVSAIRYELSAPPVALLSARR
jgi:hypothetical protein